MIGKYGLAAAHKLAVGDDRMIKKKSFVLHFVQVENRTEEIVRALAEREIKNVLAKHGVISYNLDDILYKYITGEMCNEQKG